MLCSCQSKIEPTDKEGGLFFLFIYCPESYHVYLVI